MAKLRQTATADRDFSLRPISLLTDEKMLHSAAVFCDMHYSLNLADNQKIPMEGCRAITPSHALCPETLEECMLPMLARFQRGSKCQVGRTFAKGY